MAHKQAPRRGARARATARPIPADDDPPTERRTKRRHDPVEQPGSSSAKRGRASSSGQGRGSVYPRRKILDSSPEASEKSTSSSSSSESSQPSKRPPSKPLSAGKTILKPRAMDLDDSELIAAFPEVINFFKFQSCQSFISDFRIIYPRLVQEFYMNLECTDEGYKSKVKGIVIDMPTDIAAIIFKIPDEGEDYHNFEFNLHEAYTILTGLQADESDPKQTHVTKFNTNTFPPVLRLTHHMLTTIITPQGGGRDRLTDIQRFVLYCMSKDIKGQIFSCKGSVDTTINGVDTMAQSKGRNVKKRPTSVDTSPGQVDTRDLSQGIDLPVWDSVSTHLMGRSTHSGISVT
ncbi:hypothetical protein Taro_021294 [Colocasia esculenta]|uniref:Uncharacterized protein n=1 Tax=Colocasia esculenta TaxID=4460 RepID=A0A843V4X8_COLES|nr:hypothetical protein [Colocasia esculenta]